MSRGAKIATPNILFRVVSGDPAVGLKLAISMLLASARHDAQAGLVSPFCPDPGPCSKSGCDTAIEALRGLAAQMEFENRLPGIDF